MKKNQIKIKKLNTIEIQNKYGKTIKTMNNKNNELISNNEKIAISNYKNEVMELASKYVNNIGQVRRFENQLKLKQGLINSTQNLKKLDNFKNFEEKNTELKRFKQIQKINQQNFNSLKLENERLEICLKKIKKNLQDLIGENTNLTDKNEQLFSRMKENKILHEEILTEIRNTKENEILNKVYRFDFINKNFNNKFDELVKMITPFHKKILDFEFNEKNIILNNKSKNYFKELRTYENYENIFNKNEDENVNYNEEELLNNYNIHKIEAKIDAIFDLIKEKNIVNRNIKTKNHFDKLKIIKKYFN